MSLVMGLSHRFTFKLAAIMLALTLGNAFAQSSCTIALSSDIASIFMIGITISALLIALWYMVGMLIGSPEIEATTKNEFQQLGITLLVAVALRAVLPLFCGLTVSAEGLDFSLDSNTMIMQAEENFQTLAYTTLDAYLDMSNAMMDYAETGSTYTGFSLYGISILLSPFGVFSTMANMIAPVSQSILLAYFSIIFQYTIFKIAQSQVFALLLPIGLVLRSFPLSRKFGGVLIGVSLGLSFIYPIIVTFGFELMGGIEYLSLDSIDPMTYIVPLSSLMLGTSLAGAISNAPKLSAIIGFMAGGTSLGLGVGLGDTYFMTGDLLSLYSSFGSIMLAAFFLPALEAMLVAAAVRSISGSLGTEIDISGIMRAV